MIDSKLLPLTKYPLTFLGNFCVRKNIRALHITLYNIPITVGVFLCILLQLYILATILIVVNRIFDGLDGTIARLTNTNSVAGGFVDIMVDYLFYIAVPLAHGLANPSANIHATTCILSAFVFSGVCFMATSSAAHTLSMQSALFPQKKLYYPINLIEGFETILYFIIVTLFPSLFPVVSFIIAGLIFLSMPFLIYLRYKQFASIEKNPKEKQGIR